MSEQLKIVIGADAAQATKAIAQVSQSLTNLKKPSADATNALTNLSRVAQDAPYGFIGIANNLNPLLESFQRLQKESGGTSGALKAMVAGLSGPAGVGLALGVVSSIVVAFGSKLSGATEEVKAATSAFDTLTSAQVIGKVGSEFEKVFSSVSQLRTELQLAKEGIISKTDVVRHYNETLGDAIGKVQTLDQVEKALAANAQAYIRFTLLKAAAQSALSDAAKKAVQAAEISATQIKAPTINIGDDNFVKTQKEKQAKLITILKEGAAGKVEAGKNVLLQIAEDFNRQAAALAKQFNFDFFAGEFKDKAAKAVKEKMAKPNPLDLPPLRFEVLPYIRQAVVGKVSSTGNSILNQLLKQQEQFQKAQQERAQLLADTISGVVTPAFQGMFDAISDGKNVMQSFLQGIASGLKSLLSKMAAALAQALALKAVFSLIPGLGKIGNISRGDSLGKIFGSLLGFADGGVVFGPTAALIGEGRGTSRSNPEIVAPLDKLKGMLGGISNSPDYLPVVEFTHNSFRAWYERGNRSQGRKY